jgi:hypothetical protein
MIKFNFEIPARITKNPSLIPVVIIQKSVGILGIASRLHSFGWRVMPVVRHGAKGAAEKVRGHSCRRGLVAGGVAAGLCRAIWLAR